MSALPTTQDSLSLPLGPDDFALIAEAAAQTHKTEVDFILTAALEKARDCKPKPKLTRAEWSELLREIQEDVRRTVPDPHRAFEDFLNERRADAARE